MNKFFLWFAGIAIFGLIAVQVYSVALIAFPFRYLEYQQPKLSVVVKALHPGEVLRLRVSFCRNTDKVALVNVSLLDGIVIRLPEYHSTLPKGCYKDREFGLLTIPMGTPPGVYHVKVITTFKVNADRDIGYSIESEEFNVIP